MKKILFFLIPLLMGTSCAHLQKIVGKVQVSEPTPEMTAAFQAAEKFYFGRQYDDAIFSYQSCIRNYPYNTLTAKSFYRLGEITLGQGRLDEAVEFYRKSWSKGFLDNWVADALYKNSVVLHKQGKYQDIFHLLDKIPPEMMSQNLAVRAGSLRVSAAKKSENRLEEIKGYLELYDAYEQSREAGSSMADLNWIVSRSQTMDAIGQWLQQEERDAGPWGKLMTRFDGKPAGAYLLWKVGRAAYNRGDYKGAGRSLVKFLSGYPKSEFVPEARRLYAEVEKRGEGYEEKRRSGSAVSVGVLLPLSGKYAVYGESVLHGLECAAGIYEPCHADFDVNLVVRDTEGSPKVAARQMAELAADKRVIGIIGPLPQVEVDAVVPIAEQNQIPILTLSQREDVPGLGEMVFRNFLTVGDQVATVVQYACGTKKWKRLAILYPKGSTGEEFLQHFKKEVDTCGGKVVAEQSYGGSSENYVEALNSLKGAGAFEALFIPDLYRRVVAMMPSIEFANIPNTVLLGGAGWDHPDLLKAGSRLEGSVFVDGFFPDANDAAIQQFSSTIRETYGVAPTLLEAYAYDSMKLVGMIFSQQQITSRLQLHDSLSKVRHYSGVTGEISFDEVGDARRKLMLLQVSGGEIKEIH